ncbi:MAG TPA: hypothetical protein VJ799_00825 [Nitrososphaeraceae archaeon]|nr:hypothetical protein [Nitrososphaeraceae archaeon]
MKKITFSNISELEKYLVPLMKDVMNKEVTETIRDVEQRNIQDEVYNKYEPVMYERRRRNDGLQDRKNMIHNVNTFKNGVELTVENITEGIEDDFLIADLVEYGDGHNGKEYQYKGNRLAKDYLKPRPFTKATIEELELNDEHVYSFIKGMRAKGVDLKKG